MALGTTAPCSAIDEPLTSTLPVASTDDEPYAIVPCVIVKSALRHITPWRVPKGGDGGCEGDCVVAACCVGAGGDVEGGGGDGEGCEGDGKGGGGDVEGGGGEGE